MKPEAALIKTSMKIRAHFFAASGEKTGLVRKLHAQRVSQ
jgi:hypothetical protein